ncbi:ammonium transporter [Corynebacterium tapiri]|uniref:Ammonium transporter n=1 Tax=Corynebacterium tapiri TaxID=1448266 RepID=A0A5C4U758_9CORY|nr:ammonium transporter [Corynebacterium tapiri]TNL99321.1 ammonium transporter [Corynebacterium tapiri]
MEIENTVASNGDAAWVLMSASLVLLMTPALALFYGGMSSRKHTLNMMMMSFAALGVVTITYILWGWSMSYGSHSIAGVVANPFEYFGLRNQIVDEAGNYVQGDNTYPLAIDVAFQLTFAAISTAIISGSLAGRVKFSAWVAFCALWVTLVYYPLAHMVWGGGLLSGSATSLSAWLFGTADDAARIEPIDFAGGTVVHISAGTAALVLAIVVGKRQGFGTSVTRPHNIPVVMLGAALLWFGWFGFNAGSAFAADGLAGVAWLNTTAAAASAMLAWLVVEIFRDSRPTSLGAASGLVAGLVAVTPAAGALMPLESIILGAVGGALACVAVGLKLRVGIDDSLDVVGVHLVAGLWGTIGLAFFAPDAGLQLLIVQAVIALVAMAFSAVVTGGIALAIKAVLGWRISEEDEFSGIDYAQHRESAYDVFPAN